MSLVLYMIYGYSVSTVGCPFFIVLLILCVWDLVCSLRDWDCENTLLRRMFGPERGSSKGMDELAKRQLSLSDIREMLLSFLGRDTAVLAEGFHGFPLCLQSIMPDYHLD
jgi:hypothetical protein